MVGLIYTLDATYSENENGQTGENSDLSAWVVPTGKFYTAENQHFYTFVDRFVDLRQRTLGFLTRIYSGKSVFTKIGERGLHVKIMILY